MWERQPLASESRGWRDLAGGARVSAPSLANLNRREFGRTLAAAEGRGTALVSQLSVSVSVVGAQDETRTHTPLRAPPPQDGVSANSTTWAQSAWQQWRDSNPRRPVLESIVPAPASAAVSESSERSESKHAPRGRQVAPARTGRDRAVGRPRSRRQLPEQPSEIPLGFCPHCRGAPGEFVAP